MTKGQNQERKIFQEVNLNWKLCMYNDKRVSKEISQNLLMSDGFHLMIKMSKHVQADGFHLIVNNGRKRNTNGC